VKLQNSANRILRNFGNMKYVSSESKSQSRIGDVKTVGADRYVSVVNVNGDKANIFGDYLSGVFTWESDEEFNELPLYVRHFCLMRCLSMMR